MPTKTTAEQPAGILISIDRNVHRQMKLRAFQQGVTLSAYVNAAMTEWLNTRTAEVHHGA